MGSSGSGSFSDYSGSPSNSNGSGGGSGGSSGTDQCAMAFSTGLEEVGQCDYFTNTGTVPPPGTELSIAIAQRIVALDTNGIVVGALPTRFNYLAACLNEGFNYVGVVQSSSLSPNPQATVDFAVA